MLNIAIALNQESDVISAVSEVKSKVAEEFNRIEDKYVVNAHAYDQVMKRLHDHMEPSYLDNGTVFTLIESLYFDSPEFDFFRHHYEDKEVRHKIRVRKYAPNGIWSQSPVLLELKSKRGEVTQKTRFRLHVRDFNRLANGQEIQLSATLLELNKNLPTQSLISRIHQVNALIVKYRLRPSVAVTYKRFAFEKDDLRVTVDQDVTVEIRQNLTNDGQLSIDQLDIWPKAQKVIKKYQPGENFILEVKHQGHVSQWLEDLLSQCEIKKTSFSKYCWSIARAVNAVSEQVYH